MPFPPLDPRETRAHELDEGRRRWIVVGVLALVVMIAVGVATSTWLLRSRSAVTRDVDRARSVVSSQVALNGTPLQPSIAHDRTPAEDLAVMRAREDATFTALGWSIDPTTHAAVVPDAVFARVRGRTNAPPAVAPATKRPVVTPIPGCDEGGPR